MEQKMQLSKVKSLIWFLLSFLSHLSCLNFLDDGHGVKYHLKVDLCDLTSNAEKETW
mgnify:FL=1